MCSSRIRGEIVFQKLARENGFRALNPEKNAHTHAHTAAGFGPRFFK